jgi:PAS domain S-box-containing protein
VGLGSKKPTTASDRQSDVNVLVVDDHPENILALQAMLSNSNYNVLTASSGAEALKIILKHDLAVILLDVVMPSMDGFETAARIRQREASKEIPIIFLTANARDVSYIYRAYSVGAVDYLTKPIEPDVVSAKVSVFVDLFRKNERIRRQEEQLREAERKRSELALQESEAQYEATFNSAAVGIAHANPDGEWLRVNPRFCDIVGYGREEVLRLRLQDVMHPEDLPRNLSAIQQLLDGQIARYRSEERYLHKAGQVVWVELTLSLLRDASGRAKRLIVVIEDIAERKQREAAQQFVTAASERLLSSLDYRTTLASVAQLALSNFAEVCAVMVPADSPKQSVDFIVSHADGAKAESLRNLLRTAIADPNHDLTKALNGRKAELLTEMPRELFDGQLPDSEMARRSMIIAPMMARERTIGAMIFISAGRGQAYNSMDLAISEDLAHRAAFAIENARLYEEAQRAIRARDEFLSIASHELRTPLTPLQLNLQRLLDGSQASNLRNASPERLETALRRSERQVARLTALVDNLLDVSRITSGHLTLQREEFDLAEVTKDVTERFAEEISRAGCNLQLDANRPVIGCWDRVRIEQVVTNLLANAIKYGGGKPIEITVNPQDEGAHFAIRDYGIGIAADERERIFERFERAVSSRAYGGLGLGLYIARQILNAHGGSIQVESGPGSGSLFRVWLPSEVSSDKSGLPVNIFSEADPKHRRRTPEN